MTLQEECESKCPRRGWWLAGLVLLLSCVTSLVSWVPVLPSDGLDPSWVMGMNYALAHHFTIGRDLIFTFGPLSSIYTGAYAGSYDGLLFLVSLYIAFSLWLAVSLVMNARRDAVLILLVAIVVAIFGNYRDAFFMFIPVTIALAVIAVAAVPERLTSKSLGLIALCLPSLGFLPMVKLSMSVLCMFCLLVAVLLLVFRRQYLWAMIFLGVPPVSMILVWHLTGQPLAGIFEYAINAKPIISGYTEAMSVNYNGFVLPLVFWLGAAVLCFSYFFGVKNILAKWFGSAVVGAFLFIAFKAGFVRDDGHAVLSGIALILASALVSSLLRSYYGFTGGAIGVFIGCIVIYNNVPLNFNGVVGTFSYRLIDLCAGAKVRLTVPGGYESKYQRQLAEIAVDSNIPVVDGPADVYSYGQAALLSSGIQWDPRPIFQSYSAYTPSLLEENANHLSSARGAPNVLFAVEPIDYRFPALEDGASWPVLFTQYRLDSINSRFAKLVRSKGDGLKPKTIEQKTIKLGEVVATPEVAGKIFVALDIKPSLRGILSATVYKTTQLMIRVTLASGQTKSYRLPSGMAKTNFLISPLVEHTSEFAYLFGGSELLAGNKVKAIEVYSVGFGTQPLSGDWAWNPDIKVQFSVLADAIDESVFDQLHVTKLLPVADSIEADCAGGVDTINGFTPWGGTIEVRNFLSVRGWVSFGTDGYAIGTKHIVLLTREGQDSIIGSFASQADRPDVGSYFKKASMAQAGYSAVLDARSLVGRYKLSIGLERGGRLYRCANISYDVEF